MQGARLLGLLGQLYVVWAHHMFATGAVLLPFFALTSFLIAVPTGVKFFNWIGTMWRGQLSFETPMLFSVGFLVTFLLGGLTGVLLAAPPVDFHVTDTYFVVAHFHYVLYGTIVFATFAPSEVAAKATGQDDETDPTLGADELASWVNCVRQVEVVGFNERGED